jgi:hypothetical protein
MGTYCDETDIEAITQFDVTASTDPSTTEVAAWIAQVEADVDARCLGTYTITDELVDVMPLLGYPAKGTVAWLESIARKSYDLVETNNIIPLPRIPIISVDSLSRRTSSLGSTDVWESLDEGTSSGDSFIIIKSRTKTNQYLGFGLYFHDNRPYDGFQRLKVTYDYGWSLNTSIIGEWASLKVSLKVLDAIINDSTPVGAGDYGVLDVRIGLDPARRRVDIKERLKEIETNYFPEKKLGIALI